MFILAAVGSVLLAAAMVTTALRKAGRSGDSLALRDRLGVPPRLWTAVGIPEALAGVGLVAGLWWAGLGVAAAAGVVVLMAGAVVLHVRARLLGAALAPPVGLGLFALAVVALRAMTA